MIPAPAPAAALERTPAVVRDARLGRIATLLAGSDVRVDCVSRTELDRRTGGIEDAWGLAERRQARMSLLAPFCDFLAAVRGTRPAIPAYHAGPALLVFAHELQHLKGIAHEGEAECRALAAVRSTATRGFGVRDARWLATMVAAAQRQHERLAPIYRTRC